LKNFETATPNFAFWMRVRTARKPKINVITLGCSKNTYDSEVLLGQLKKSGYDAEHESTGQDYQVVVINTCGFIETAKEESINTILTGAEAKKRGEIQKLIVTGCLSERFKNELKKEIPEVDAWFGSRELPALLKFLKADYRQELIGERQLSTPSHYAYFKISEGCNRPCSFCAIPLMRGRHRSRAMEELIDEAKKLGQKGVKELIIIAQDSTYYGLDLYGKRALAELLKRLTDVAGIEWIRLHYAFPSGFPKDVLKVIAEEKKICKYLDIPLQHIHDDMLKSMRRGITAEKTRRLLKEIKNTVPEIAVRTTFIVGYPGETEAHFEALCRFIEEEKFDRMGVFTYSHEEGTYAYSLKDNVPFRIKQERAGRLMEIQQKISETKNQSLLFKKIKVLIDRTDGINSFGRSEHDSPEVDNEIIVENDCIQPGTFIQALIIDAGAYDLYAQKIS